MFAYELHKRNVKLNHQKKITFIIIYETNVSEKIHAVSAKEL